jgi:ribosomal protein S18 acetylase RimI-like enzyme
VARRAWETLRYGSGDDDGPHAELLSMAVDYEVRRRGLGRALGDRFLTAMAERGVDGVRVVVGAHNQGAIAAYEAMGFERRDTIEVHEGEPSEVLTWSAR